MPDINISNLQVPPTTTMPAHVASANPHPQYALVSDIANIAKSKIAVSDLADVNVVEPQLANTILIYDGNNYNPIDMTSLGTLIQIPMATSNYATTVTSGVVRLATVNDIIANDQSAVVTASALNDVVSSNLYTLPVATSSTLGGVKTLETDHPNVKKFIADLITSNHSDDHLITSYVPQIQYNQFVNVKVAEDLRGNNEIYYSTHAGPISGDDNAEASAAINAYKVGYNVYSNGVMSGRTKIGTADYSMINITVHEQGAAYDINTKGRVTVLQEGIIKRLTVDKDCYATIQGEAHNVLVSTDVDRAEIPMGGIGGLMEITNHGHATYCTITGYGNVRVGAYDTEGIIENVIVSDISQGNSNYYGLVVATTGKAFNVVLTGSYAGAIISGYAKDVVVHSGCCLWTHTSTTKIDNLILYNGAEIKLNPGVEITGCIAYPGAVLTDFQDCSVTFNTCHEPNHTIKPVYSTCQHFSKIFDSETSKTKLKNIQGDWYFEQDVPSHKVPYRVAMLYGTSTYTQNITSSYDGTITSTGWRQVENWRTILYATTPPKCFVRSDTDKITSMNAIDFTSEGDYQRYNTLSKNAVVCYPAIITKMGKPTATGTIRYEVVPDFGPDAYHEAWAKSEGANPPTNMLTRQYLATTVSTDTNDDVVAVKIENYGEFITSENSLAFYNQIQSKMFEELTATNTSISWEVAF